MVGSLLVVSGQHLLDCPQDGEDTMSTIDEWVSDDEHWSVRSDTDAPTKWYTDTIGQDSLQLTTCG